MSRCTIAVDIDDTATYLLPHWIDWLNQMYGTNVNCNDIDKWDVPSFFPTLTRQQVFSPLTVEWFWDRITPKPMAVEYLQKLINLEYDIYFCTATDYRNVKPKFERVIKRLFPFIDWSHIIVTANKSLIATDFIIDDAPHNLMGNQKHKILMDMSHNRDFDVTKSDIVRVNDWREAYKYITSFKR